MDWRKALGRIAPTLASAIPLGGPIGAAAVNVISALFGTTPDETAIEAKVASLTAADLLALKNADAQFAKDMKALDVDVFKVDALDRADARGLLKATGSRVAPAIALALHVLLIGMVYALFQHEIPEANRSAFDILLGVVGAGTNGVWNFYFGSSHGSQAKDATVATLASGATK